MGWSWTDMRQRKKWLPTTMTVNRHLPSNPPSLTVPSNRQQLYRADGVMTVTTFHYRQISTPYISRRVLIWPLKLIFSTIPLAVDRLSAAPELFLPSQEMNPCSQNLMADTFHCHEHYPPRISMHIPNARASTPWAW